MFDASGLVDLDAAAVAGVDAASSVLATLASLPAAAMSDDALTDGVLALETARRFLDAAELARLAELARRGTTDTRFGARTDRWLAHEAKLPRAVATARVRTATKLDGELAPLGDALAAGRIGFDHARVLADAANDRNADRLAALTDELCDLAGAATFSRWSAEVRGLADELDTDGGHDPTRDRADQRLRVRRVGDVTVLDGQLAGDGAHIAHSALDQIADELFRLHTRDAAHTGDAAPGRPQLLAEAFVELCRRGLAVDPARSTPPRTEATVVINAAEPDRVTDSSGTRLTDTALLLCDPTLAPIVTTFSGLPLALGRTRRLASPAQVRAVRLRDGGCTFPGCESPSNWNDTHHGDDWDHGGTTDVDRLCGLCRHHHRVAHRPDWTLQLTDDAWTLWTRPDGHTFWGQRHQHQRAGPIPDT